MNIFVFVLQVLIALYSSIYNRTRRIKKTITTTSQLHKRLIILERRYEVMIKKLFVLFMVIAFYLIIGITSAGIQLRFNGTIKIENSVLAASFATIPEIEDSLLKTRSVILPLGIPNAYIPDKFSWQGADKKVLFVCPRIASHAFYYGKVYEEFKANLGNFPYLIAGYQPIKVDDPNVIGFASDEVYRALFKDLALMFYHSREPRHLHYHPLEAIASGMPVIYMRGGLMEMFGGQEQPGACNNYHESHEKIQRILDGDTEFIKAIQKSQLEIIKPFKWEYCRNEWQKIFLGQVLTS
jgi:glycosyltransferase involved in cell wall biosynthesis